MLNEAPQFVPKVHPATCAVEADDPMTLTATPVAGDPENMLRCVIQEYAWMGWNLDQLVLISESVAHPSRIGS